MKKPSTVYRFCRFLCRVILRGMCRLEAHHIERVPEEGGFLMVSNHASNLDPPIVGCLLKREAHYLAKAELFEPPVLRWVLPRINAHPIRRGTADRQGMKECVKAIREGGLLTIFPEGTRTPDGELGEAKPGVAMIAVQAKTQCIPAWVEGSYHAWPRHHKLPRFGKVHVYYGEPFDLPERPEDMDRKDYYQVCADEMLRRIAALRPENGATPTDGEEAQ